MDGVEWEKGKNAKILSSLRQKYSRLSKKPQEQNQILPSIETQLASVMQAKQTCMRPLNYSRDFQSLT